MEKVFFLNLFFNFNYMYLFYFIPAPDTLYKQFGSRSGLTKCF